MSDSLVTVIVVAPDEFDAAAIARARALAQNLDELFATGGTVEDLRDLGLRADDIECVFGLDMPTNCEVMLDAFIVWWHTGLGGGDTCRRDLPGHSGWSITVAGGTSGGDDTFAGEGYRLISQVDALGLLSALGAL